MSSLPISPLAQAADTVVMVAAGGALETASAIAEVVLVGFLVLFVAGLSILLFELKRLNENVRKTSTLVRQRMDPILDRGKVVAENVEYISMAVRHDVQKLTDSVRALRERLDLASTRMEERIEDFNALMEVVQGEAEDILIDTAAAVEGVRAGARDLGGRRGASALREGADDGGSGRAGRGGGPGGGEPTRGAVREAGGAD